MERYVQFEPFMIEDFETDHWDHLKHRHNHFEIIFIMHGSGKHIVDDHEMTYKDGDLFLLRPEDSHEFRVDRMTRFIYFKFTQLYVSNNKLQVPEHWNREVDLLLRKSLVSHSSLLNSAEDIGMTRNLMEMISGECRRSSARYREIIFQLFSVILTLIKRNQPQPYQNFEEDDTSKIESILYYIECNIHDPDALSGKKIAEEFYLSPNYIGSFFKRNTGVTLSGYISEYRYKLIEQRLRYSRDSLKQIAADFGFFDASHLNKFFKKHAGESPSDYRMETGQED
ncbi:AraC family transcriptional regulator [Aliifodinibius sp. S!AR15-10]|uniref:helix-turn-helix domain-containing protein n=1 Tax=Aliifodinibius sp. S!AR15-10 TaxID=2950437 RepID=UPI00285B28E0|nr:AraC family transcriptional regulator [Aliifodinibius sp. S!AR15-10]MDR8393773.1 AraC family transcriptional regulator [Aliifodinibius sp. S!AR15-10]